MNFSNILNEIENADPEIFERTDPRRNVIKNFMNFGSKLALTAIPVALGGLLNKAYTQSIPGKVMDVLVFALGLEHLENRYYATGLNTPGLIPAKDMINTIGEHEKAHVLFLQTAISAAGGRPEPEGKYDYTAGGLYPNVFSDYKQFLSVAQAFEDTGVAAYKGQAVHAKKSNAILESALRIHSVEARHAAHIRFVRRVSGFDPKVKPWIIGSDNTKGTPVYPIYKKESKHSEVVLFNINGIGGYNTGNAGTSAFDQPLRRNQIEAIVAPFMARK